MTLASRPGDKARREGRRATAARPLVIAVDHTLINCDLARETLVTYLKLNPGRFFDVLGWLWRGGVKRQLAERVPVDVTFLPVNETLVAFAKDEAAAGRRVFFAVATDSPLSGQLKARFPFVEGVITAGNSEDPKAPAMADVLARQFPEGFEYAGSSVADLDVWRRASSAILVGASSHVQRRAAALVPISASIPHPSRFQGVLASLRLHQWVKNLLVFAPIVLGGQLGDMPSLLATVAAFLALGLVASSTYLINDILDVADDRRHWSKRERPIAKGLLSASAASVWAGIGLAAGLALAAAISLSVLGVLLLYVVLTLSYSLGLKRLPLIDGLVLATQFTLRLALGVAAAQVPPSPWLFVFSMFLFTSLSLAKRYTELGRLGMMQGTQIAGRGYRTEDAPLVLAIGVAAGLGAVVIVILYIIEDAFRQSFYGSTASLWGFPPLVFLLVCRIWLVTVRGEMHDDPVKFMLADRVSQSLLAILIMCFFLAWLA
jgi:4-hydroxybenzoate polyprenyltransferase